VTAIDGGIGIYQAGMQWGNAAQDLTNAESNLGASWNLINNQP
jgi:hypothetical protein